MIKCHLNYKKLDFFINKIINEFSIIFSPAIEGGHQDHDTIGFNIFIKAFEELKVKEYLEAYKIEIESENIEKKVNVEEINFSESNDLSSIYLSKILF